MAVEVAFEPFALLGAKKDKQLEYGQYTRLFYFDKVIGTDLVESEILKKGRPRWVSMEDTKHLLASFRKQFLSITRIRNGLTLLSIAVNRFSKKPKGRENRDENPLQSDMAKRSIGNIPDENPPNFEHTLPLVGCPNGTAPRVIDRSQHLGHTTEVSTGINTEEQVDRPTLRGFLECFVKTLVSRIGGAPDLIFERFVNIIFRV